MRILVVDDGPDQAESLALYLRMAGCEAECALNSGEALMRLAGPPPDAVVVDEAMPGMPGHALIRQMRRTPGLEGVPVALISGLPIEDVRQAALAVEAMGRVRYFQKPAEPDELLSWLREQAGEPEPKGVVP